MPTKADLEQLVDSLLKERDAATKALTDFKTQVVEVGEKYAKENDFCFEYDRMLSELGLDRPMRDHEVRAKITISFDLQAEWGRGRPTDQPPHTAAQLKKHVNMVEDDFDEVLDYYFDNQMVMNFDVSITNFKTAKDLATANR